MRKYSLAATVLAFGASLAAAEEGAIVREAAPVPARAAAEEKRATPSPFDEPAFVKVISLAGKLVKEEKVHFKGRTNTVYSLTGDKGQRTYLPTRKAGIEGGIDLDRFVDKDVKMVVKGVEIVKGEREYVRVMMVINVEPIEAAAPSPGADAQKEGPRTDQAGTPERK